MPRSGTAGSPPSSFAPASTSRLFIALWPLPDVRDSLAAARDSIDWSPTARPVATGKLHLTLHFIGPVERSRIGLLRDSIGLRFEPFELSLGHFEMWPGGIAVWQPHATPHALERLHASLGSALAALGFACERRFRPHVTLARRAAGSLIATPLPSLRWRVDGFALIESRLGAGGGYSVLQRYS